MVTVVEVGGQTARIGIDAPRSIPVYRAELWAAVRDENRAAAEDGPAVLPPLE
ncbi:MAG: carbon storage regulator [Solirubrobacteraceae bacterium]